MGGAWSWGAGGGLVVEGWSFVVWVSITGLSFCRGGERDLMRGERGCDVCIA